MAGGVGVVPFGLTRRSPRRGINRRSLGGQLVSVDKRKGHKSFMSLFILSLKKGNK